MTYRYFVTRNDEPEREVTKKNFVLAEREAGFRNTMGHPEEPATSGFSGGTRHMRISGRIDFWENCRWPDCAADMSSEMCPNSHRQYCVDHCGEDHTN